jgi:hypothetical protein
MIAATAPAIGPDPREASQLAQNLARNRGYAVLPCSADGQPLIPLRQASTLALSISNAWLRAPGPLIGIATGETSGIWVLEITPDAIDWWRDNNRRLLPTRCYQTRGNGLHCYFRDGSGIPSSTDRIASGVNTHGNGSFVVHWFAAGLHCHDHSPPSPWPQWLRDVLEMAA